MLDTNLNITDPEAFSLMLTSEYFQPLICNRKENPSSDLDGVFQQIVVYCGVEKYGTQDCYKIELEYGHIHLDDDTFHCVAVGVENIIHRVISEVDVNSAINRLPPNWWDYSSKALARIALGVSES